MSILLDAGSKVVVQGITGNEGSFHAGQCREYGTRIVAGVTPGKGGREVDGVPVFDTVADAVRETGADVSLIFVPPRFAADAVYEAAEAGVGLIVTITEGIPVHDMVGVKAYLRSCGARMIGPNCPGLITPGQAKAGIMPGHIHRPGRVGVISRSGTLTYEAVHQLTQREIGQTTCIGIGGDPIIGSTFIDLLDLFGEDDETEAVVLIGEIGGSAEEDAAAWVIESGFDKPIVSFVAGRTAPPGKRMGHAGAIVSGGQGTAEGKMEAMRRAGFHVVENPARIGETVAEALS